MAKLERFLTTGTLSGLYSFLVPASIAKWVEAGLVRVDGRGARCEQDVINHYVGRLQQELDRAKAKQDAASLREAIEMAKLRKLELEADLIEIERDTKRGKLVEIEPAIAEIDEAFARVRTKLMALPDRLALQLSGMNDPNDIQDLLDGVVRETLAELHTQLTTGEEDEDDETYSTDEAA